MLYENADVPTDSYTPENAAVRNGDHISIQVPRYLQEEVAEVNEKHYRCRYIPPRINAF